MGNIFTLNHKLMFRLNKFQFQLCISLPLVNWLPDCVCTSNSEIVYFSD